MLVGWPVLVAAANSGYISSEVDQKFVQRVRPTP